MKRNMIEKCHLQIECGTGQSVCLIFLLFFYSHKAWVRQNKSDDDDENFN